MRRCVQKKKKNAVSGDNTFLLLVACMRCHTVSAVVLWILTVLCVGFGILAWHLILAWPARSESENEKRTFKALLSGVTLWFVGLLALSGAIVYSVIAYQCRRDPKACCCTPGGCYGREGCCWSCIDADAPNCCPDWCYQNCCDCCCIGGALKLLQEESAVAAAGSEVAVPQVDVARLAAVIAAILKHCLINSHRHRTPRTLYCTEELLRNAKAICLWTRLIKSTAFDKNFNYNC